MESSLSSTPTISYSLDFPYTLYNICLRQFHHVFRIRLSRMILSTTLVHSSIFVSACVHVNTWKFTSIIVFTVHTFARTREGRQSERTSGRAWAERTSRAGRSRCSPHDLRAYRRALGRTRYSPTRRARLAHCVPLWDTLPSLDLGIDKLYPYIYCTILKLLFILREAISFCFYLSL